MDSTGQSVVSFGHLTEENTWFELSPRQRNHFEAAQRLNNILRDKPHGIQQLLWKSGYQNLFGEMPSRFAFEILFVLISNFIRIFLNCREFLPSQSSDACRLHGTLQLTKVAGNFHITAGKVLPLPMRAHAHLSPMMDDERFNYSHRIDKFSFGHSSTLVQPLEGDEVITDKGLVISSIWKELKLICRYVGAMLFQYFVTAVPTEIESLVSASSGIHGSMKTWQYSVRNQSRVIGHQKGSHGIPGIYFKYKTNLINLQWLRDSKAI